MSVTFCAVVYLMGFLLGVVLGWHLFGVIGKNTINYEAAALEAKITNFLK